MLNNTRVIIILQCINVSNQHLIYLKFIHSYFNYSSIKLKLNKLYITMQMVKYNQSNIEKEQKTARLTPLAIKTFY